MQFDDLFPNRPGSNAIANLCLLNTKRICHYMFPSQSVKKGDLPRRKFHTVLIGNMDHWSWGTLLRKSQKMSSQTNTGAMAMLASTYLHQQGYWHP